MKKQFLSTALSSLLCFSAHADNTQNQTNSDEKITPIAQTTQETAAPEIKSKLAAAPMALPVIDCEYAIPATTTTIDRTIISNWAEKAAVQAFEFNPATMTAQLDKLKNCFTDQGWQGYYDALVKSGNLESIKTHSLTVTSKIAGELKIDPTKDNQWKITLPMQVVYKNEKETFNQELSVDLLVGRKVSGGLGIMQVIASQKDATVALSN